MLQAQMLKTRERIIPFTDLATQGREILDNAQKTPVVVTDEGRPAAYLVNVELFDELVERLAVLEKAELAANIAIAEKQFENGQHYSLAEAAEMLGVNLDDE